MTAALLPSPPSPWRIEPVRSGRWPWHARYVVTDGDRRFEHAAETDAQWLCERLNWLAWCAGDDDDGK